MAQIDRSALKLYIGVCEDQLRKLLVAKLTAAGFAPKQIVPDDILTMEPTFGPAEEAIFLVHAGEDREKTHMLAEHLHRNWSLKGSVLYIVFHPGEIQDEDMFRLWSLDAIERFDAPEQFVVINSSVLAESSSTVQWIIKLISLVGERETATDSSS